MNKKFFELAGSENDENEPNGNATNFVNDDNLR